MNISKCKTCKNFDSFFCACTLYTEEVYLGEGDFDSYYCSCKSITPKECKYERVKE